MLAVSGVDGGDMRDDKRLRKALMEASNTLADEVDALDERHYLRRVCAAKATIDSALAEKLAEGVVWEGDGWALVNGIVEFEIAEHYLAESDLLLPIEDGEAVWITVTKLSKLEEVEDGQN